jgi:NADPH2:quinone reductase
MRALLLDGPCDPGALQVADVAAPAPADGEVVVRVRRSAINRSDVLNVRGLPITVFPRVPGRDFAGTVVAGPSEHLGREVWGTGSGDLGFTRHGAHAERIGLPLDAIVDQPAGWSAEQAGASGLSYATAEAGLSRARIAPGETVLVTGAVGGVGAAALAIAQWRGATVIGAVKDDEERALLERRWPGVAVIVTTTADLGAAVVEQTGGRGVDVAFDTVGNPLFAAVLGTLAMGGRMVVVVGAPGGEVPFDLAGFYRRDLSLFGVNTTRYDSAWCAGLLRGLAPGFEDGALPPIEVARTIGLAEAGGGYEAVWAGERGGRVVIDLER